MADIHLHTLAKGEKNRKDFPTYTYQIVKHSLPGLFVGIGIDNIVKNLQCRYKLKPLIWIVVQFVIMIVVLYLVEKYVSASYASEWQNVTAGLFFVSFFFGSQVNLMTNIRSLSDAQHD